MRRLLAIALAMGMAGCASQANPKLAICDGKHRRSANPYGSVLPTVLGPSPSASPKPPGPQSAVDPRSFLPCGARA